MDGADRGISVLSSVGCLRAMCIPFYVLLSLKYLLYGGLGYEKVFIEEVVAARRAAASLFIHAALYRGGKKMVKNSLGSESLGVQSCRFHEL